MNFRQTMLEAARKARSSGELERGEYVRIWLASLNPKNVEKCQQFVEDEAAAAGVSLPKSNGADAPDWTSILEFIKTLLPLILQLISLFG